MDGELYLVQLLLPLADNDGRSFPRSAYDGVRNELTERFGGVTAYVRAPAEGLWKEDAHHVTRDDVVIYEVMTGELNRRWWAAYRLALQARFLQEELVVRASVIERL